MNFLGLKLIAGRAIAFATTLILSLAVVTSTPRFKERRQRYFASAALNGSVSRMQLLHLAGADVNSAAASRTPLCLAASEGRLTAVRYLLNEGADINGPQPDGNTALTEATFFGHEAVVKELLVRGANVNALSAGGTALDIAISKNSTAVIELLKHYGAKRADEIR
jgi:ankyrin repeat protein